MITRMMMKTQWSENYFRYDNIYCNPTVHGSIDFAELTRKAFFEIDPDCVIVELPQSFMKPVIDGIKRLPYLSAVIFEDKNNLYYNIPIVPTDSIIEAIRLAIEFGKDIYFVDRDIKGLRLPNFIQPDTYYLKKIGLKDYYNSTSSYIPSIKSNDPHFEREIAMAHTTRQLSFSYNRILFVYGLSHHKNLVELFDQKLSSETADVMRHDVKLMHVENTSYLDLLPTMPFLTYLYEISRKGLSSYHLGIEFPPEDDHQLESVNRIIDFLHYVNEKAEYIRTIHTSNYSSDTYDMVQELILQSRKLYNREWNDYASDGKLSMLLKFVRNYALLENSLVPTPYQLVVAGKNFINDDYAWELARLIHFYPFVDNVDGLPEIYSHKRNALINDEVKSLKSYFPISEWLIQDIPIKKRPKEQRKGDWQKVWNSGYTIISYPPEDIIIENYFQYLRKRGKKVLEDDHIRTVEFKDSILDGLDIKETIRNIHLGKIFVKEEIPIKGDVGTVVIIFEEKDNVKDYPYNLTWYAEHQNESDLVFYSTMPGDKFVGPGISRAEYGGLLSIYPPQRMFDVWTDPRFQKAKSRQEHLLLAAIHYADKKYIVYVAHKPPAPTYLSLAERLGHHIIYIPIQQLNKNMLNKIRTVHFLSNPKLRSIASKYIRL